MTPRDRDILARTIYGEARGEPYEGKVAIGRTVISRFMAKRWFSGKSIAATAQKAWQYSCWNRNDPNRAKLLAASNAKLATCLRAADAALAGEGPEWLAGCTHYYAPAVVDCPKWALGKTPAGKIGGHLFFKDID